MIRSTAKPPYRVRRILANGVEIRDYPEQIWACTQSRDLDQGFRTLSGYIFGDNKRGERIGMTAPVITERQALGTVMSFVMPERYRLSELPLPNTARIKIKRVKRMRLASLGFSGNVTAESYKRNLDLLLHTLKESGIVPAGDALLMQYDDFYTQPFLRRNEIAVPVEPGDLG